MSPFGHLYALNFFTQVAFLGLQYPFRANKPVGMEHKPSHLRLVETSPWNDPQAFKLDFAEQLRESNKRRYHPLPAMFIGIRPIQTRQLRLHPPISRIEWIIFVCGVSGAALFGWMVS